MAFYFLFQHVHCLGPRKVNQLFGAEFCTFVYYFDFDSEFICMCSKLVCTKQQIQKYLERLENHY